MPRLVEGLPPRARYDQVAIDVELFGADRYRLHRPYGRLAALTICPDGETVYVVTKESDVEKALARIHSAVWIFHNSSFDLAHLRRWADVPPRDASHFWDTFNMERILWNGYFQDFGLDDLSRRYLSQYMDKSVRKEFSNAEVLTPAMLEYSIQDTAATWKIAQAQQLEVENGRTESGEYPAWKVWSEIDGPAIWAVLDFKGITLNVSAWKALAEENEQRAEEIADRLGFNPGSPKQVLAALKREGLKLDSTGEEVLAPYKESYPIVRDILDYRESQKLAGTYGNDMIEKYVEPDGRIYANFITTGAITGRMSCHDPNMQNIPRDKRYRSCFVAPRGRRLNIADVNQQEPRLTAEVSGDPALQKVFMDGEDSHLAVTRVIYSNNNLTKENKEERRNGKAVNLGLVYGLTHYGLAKRINVSEHVAAQFIQKYFGRFSGVKRWMIRARENAERTGKVETLSGRIHHLNLYSNQSANHALNTPIQGSAADMIKLTLNILHRHWGKDLPVDIVIHDELVSEAPTKEIKKVQKSVNAAMTEAFLILAPHVSALNLVDAHIGTSWADKG